MGKKDISIKTWLKMKSRFADIFNGVCFDGRQIVKPEELVNIDKELDFNFYDKYGGLKYVQRFQDVAMLWNGIFLRILLTLEDQDKVHYAMPVKNMVMNSLSYTEQMRGIWDGIPQKEKDSMVGSAEFFSRFRKEDKLYPVITLVFYRGEEWDGNMDLYDMFDLDEIRDDELMMSVLMKYVPNYHINLFNPCDINDISVFKSDLQMFIGVLKCSKDKVKMKDFIFEHKEYFSNLDYESGIVYDQVLNVGKLVKKDLNKEGENVDMCKAIQDMYDGAKQEGMQQGIEQGIEQGISNLVSTLNELKISDAQIIHKLMEKYNLTTEEASKYLEVYCKM